MRPERLKTGAYDWRVLSMTPEQCVDNNEDGQCSPATLEIRLSERLSGFRLAAVFMHEVQHALQWHFDHWGEITPEQSATCAGEGQVMFWRDNPEALEWWLGLLNGG